MHQIYGQMYEMDKIMTIAKKYKLKVIEVAHNHMGQLTKVKKLVRRFVGLASRSIQQKFLVPMETHLLQLTIYSFMIKLGE